MIKESLLSIDLTHILEKTNPLWDELRGKRIFITGGTGFFGKWLLESFVWANDNLDLNASALVLTRNCDAFQKKAPHLAAHPAIQFHIGDVRNFIFPEEEFSHIIHAATSASAKLNHEDPLLMFDTIVEGARHTLEFARHCKAERFLLTSSGAVYGKQPVDLTHIPEDYQGAPDPTQPSSAYGEGKRLSELLCVIYQKMYGIETVIARCFAFVGPYLNLDIHYAIGNFIRDGLAGGPICISGDGTPHRSYLYAADLSVWLWTLLIRGKPGEAYNVGSENAFSIRDLAHKVASVFSHCPEVVVSEYHATEQPERYIPCTQKARNELGLDCWINLDASIDKTVNWIRQRYTCSY